MSTDHDPGYDAARLAADPRTDWETLHRIAEDHPELRPEIAANPNTYPELLDALAALGDPEIDAALAWRDQAGHAQPVYEGLSTEEPRLPAMEEETGQFQALMDDAAEEISEAPGVFEGDQQHEDIPAEEDWAPVQPEGASEDWQEAAAAPADTQPAASARPTVERFELPAREPEPLPEEQRDDADLSAALPAAAGTGSGGSGGGSAGGMLPQGEPDRPRSGNRAGMLALAIGLPVVAVVATAALIVMLLGEDEQPVAEGPAEEQEQPAETEEDAPEEAEEDAGGQEAELAEARTAVQQLPESTTCSDPEEDAEPVAAYAALAAAAEDWSGEDEELLEFTFEDLQVACDTEHAAGVFHALRGDGESPETLTASLDEVGVEWADLAYGVSAESMDSFVTPDGNIHCEWDEGVRCTVQDFDFNPPSGCDESTTYSLSVDDAGPTCDDPVEEDAGRETLDHDQTAAIGVLACVSLEDRVSCYNMVDGSGFELSERGHYTY